MGKQAAKVKNTKRATKLLEEVNEELNEQQKLFCILYTTDRFCFGNASASYAEAYGLNEKQRKTTARQLGYKLLTNVYIKGFINDFLKLGFTDAAVDNELAKVMKQDRQLQPKIQAIAEYNKLQGRITDKHDILSGGEPIQGITYVLPDGTTDHKTYSKTAPRIPGA